MLTSSKFFGILASALVTSIFGFIVGNYGLLNNPVLLGKLIAFQTIISYSGAAIAYYIAGKNYSKLKY